MSKKYEREEREVERLEKQVRELKSLNKSLLKRLRKLNKGYQSYLDKELEEETPKVLLKEEPKICFDCGKGTLEVKIVLNRRWRACTICSKKTKVKIIE